MKAHFRTTTDNALNEGHKESGPIQMPFTVELFGGRFRNGQAVKRVFHPEDVRSGET